MTSVEWDVRQMEVEVLHNLLLNMDCEQWKVHLQLQMVPLSHRSPVLLFFFLHYLWIISPAIGAAPNLIPEKV